MLRSSWMLLSAVPLCAAVACTPAEPTGSASDTGGVGDGCASSADCALPLRCLAQSGGNVCVRTCIGETDCGDAACLPVPGAGFGYCDPFGAAPDGGDPDTGDPGADPGPDPDPDSDPNPGVDPDDGPVCDDDVRNGTETDIDCGGTCQACALGDRCAGHTDCLSGRCDDGVCAAPGGALLGDGSLASVSLTLVGDRGLQRPAALAFNPAQPGELWVVNQEDDSLTVFLDATGPGPADQQIQDFSAHFLAYVSAISFGDRGTFATCGEGANDYHGRQAPDDFMGPVMWPSDRDMFARVRDASEVHLDMLHDSPNCVGVAASGANTFYAFNGELGLIDWYDFGRPHEPGGTDHSDGSKKRLDVAVRRAPGVPSGMVFDAASGLLYVADTGNNRLLSVDTRSGTPAGTVRSWDDEQDLQRVTGLVTTVLTSNLNQPSGLALHDGTLYLANHGDGTLLAFDLDGAEVNRLDTELGGGTLTGLAIGPDGRLYAIDRRAQRVIRVEPR